MSKPKGTKKAPQENRAFMVTQIDFEGHPIKQTMLFTNNTRNKPADGKKMGLTITDEFKFPVLTEVGYEDVIRKTGMEKVVVENYIATRKRKLADMPKLSKICEKCMSLDMDSFIPGRFYLTFAPDADGGEEELSLVGTGMDLYWVVDDVKTMQMIGKGNLVGVVS